MPELHAPFGGSTASRTMNCPGWRQLVDTLPQSDDDGSEYANRGTLLHNAMEKILSEDDVYDPREVIGMEYKGVVLDEELYLEKIVPALEACEEIFDKYGIEEWVCEEKVVLDEEDAWGTADVLGAGPVWSLVLDFKFGDGILVTPVENEQFLFYGAAAHQTPETEDLFEGREDVVFAVVQPTNHKDGDYECWQTKTSRLPLFADQFLDTVEQAKGPDPDLCAGSWCKFCPAAAICPQKTGAAHQAKLLDPGDIEQLASNLKLAHELEDWIAAVKAAAHQQLEKGAQIRGWKLVMKRATRKWKDDTKALQAFARKLGGKANVVKETVLTPAQIEKVAKAQGKDIEKLLQTHTVKSSSGTTIAEAKDKREAVVGGDALAAALATVQ